MTGFTLTDILEILYLLGAVQGLFLAAVLASRHRNALPNRLLAGLMLLFSVDLAMAVYHASGASRHTPSLIGLDLASAFLYGPLLYLYARALIQEQPVLSRQDGWHFLPFVLLALFFLPFVLQPGDEKLALMEDPSLSLQTRVLGILAPFKLIHGFAYLGLVVMTLRGYRQNTLPSPRKEAIATWLRTLIVGGVAILGISVLQFALPGSSPHVVGMDPDGLSDDITLLAVAVFVYTLGYFGLRHPDLFAPPLAPQPETPAPPKTIPYARSGMNANEATRVAERLADRMATDHLYRRPDLTLRVLADELGVSTHNLTEVLSTQLGQSFYEAVNRYRVEEVKARLADPAHAHWTVLAIGMEAGFKAKSSFNAAFKRHTGMTPSQYRQRHGVAA
ncbi:MAG: helix-turn-helix transcriptional regulator [Bacteroidota bacterium]